MALALTALRGLQHVKKFSRFSRKWAPFGVVTLASNANGPASDKRSEGDGGSYAGGWSWAANVAWQASYLATSAVLDIRTVKCVFSDVKDTDVDVLTEILVCYGAEVVNVDEARQEGQPEKELFSGGGDKLWPLCNMAAHFHSQEDAASALHHITRDFPELAVETESIDLSNEDWVQSVKDSYQPMQVANGVWVVPDWCQPPNPQATNIMLYPGLAFGTGDHATTQLCLEQLMNTGLQGKSLIDYGTGSGILAIGALLLGAKKAVGVDADPVAVRAAIQNAELNGVEDKFTVLGCGHSGDDDDPLAEGGLQPRRFDICVANILKGPLLELCERFAGYVKPGGTVIVSGILKEQVEDIRRVYSKHFVDLDTKVKEEWAVVVGHRAPSE